MPNQPTQVLIVDDDTEICGLLVNYLRDFGMNAQGVHDGAAMRTAMAANRYDLVILDLMLPGEDGLSLCRQLRVSSEIPVIMLTARGETADRVVGLELGADDYIIKPFDPRELVARIHTILRRSRQGDKPATQLPEDQVGFDGWKLNRTMRQLVSPQQMVVPLSNAEFRLLWAFLERPRRVLSRDQLMDAARGQLATAFDRSIDLLVSRLRQKLDDEPKNPRLLKTVRGEGYLFDAQVMR
ncbi:MAG: putative two-component response regulator [Burkholderiaceae bacterium]|nr:putative two-component response regulator [Burkholderiaceae bacterium]